VSTAYSLIATQMWPVPELQRQFGRSCCIAGGRSAQLFITTASAQYHIRKPVRRQSGRPNFLTGRGLRHPASAGCGTARAGDSEDKGAAVPLSFAGPLRVTNGEGEKGIYVTGSTRPVRMPVERLFPNCRSTRNLAYHLSQNSRFGTQWLL